MTADFPASDQATVVTVPPTSSASEREDAIRAIVTRLSRPSRSGGSVIERAAILAEGADSEAIIRWIIAHDGEPEAIASSARGLHGTRSTGGAAERRPPRYVLPAGVLTRTSRARIEQTP